MRTNLCKINLKLDCFRLFYMKDYHIGKNIEADTKLMVTRLLVILHELPNNQVEHNYGA